MTTWGIIAIASMYLGLLFFLAHIIEKRKANGKTSYNRWMYALALPVYCTAWTYYGSVGKAVNDGWEFLTIYIGPILTIPLWWIVLRKIIRVCTVQRISTLPDFISNRYGKSLTLSVLSSVFIVIGIIPYISIQLKSIASSLRILTNTGLAQTATQSFLLNDSAFYLTIVLAIFIIVFVFRSLETTDKHHGLMGAIAADSIIKLVAFLLVGCYVTFYLFDGFGDLFAKSDPQIVSKFEKINPDQSIEWFAMLSLSMSAILLLPRQFQVAVAENENENDIKTAAWVLPLYLLLINFFVVPIALAGKYYLPSSIDPDSYVLVLPLANGETTLAAFTFLGGFSASTAMIIVSTIALSMILSNNVLVPLVLKRVENKKFYAFLPLKSRRIAVFVILFLAYFYYKFVSDRFPLVSIGLISFAAMIQFLPLVLGALFWKDGNTYGATWGLIGGFVVWSYTLVLPTLVVVGLFPQSILSEGPLGIGWLRPESLFGMQLSPIAHGTLWSVFVNTSLYFFGSVLKDQSPKERNLAEFYYDIYDYSTKSEERLVWKGHLAYNDLIRVSENLLGSDRTKEVVEHFSHYYKTPKKPNGEADPTFVNYVEKVLSGAVGSSSARLLISSLAKEEEVELKDVIKLLKDTSEITKLNRELQARSNELRRKTNDLVTANERLKNMDEEKDDFISTVTHELRTPLTSIKAFVEIIQDNPELEEKERDRFLTNMNDEIDRMTRLINQVLDMEKLESGSAHLNKVVIKPAEILESSLQVMQQLFQSKNVQIVRDFSSIEFLEVDGDPDRLKQVFINILSNSIKYVDPEKGMIKISGQLVHERLSISISDNGRGIKKENMDRIFDKFFQARDQTRKKPKGSGLGLSITKRILDLHQGSIHVESTFGKGATFVITLPLPLNQEPKIELSEIANEE
jgi:Na+/proline symporter/signal transduction histidine kinase